MQSLTGIQKVTIVMLAILIVGGGYYFSQSKAGVTVGVVAVSPTGFVCGTSTVNDADGNTYNTVQVGQQCWMKQNMRVGTRINVASNQTNNGTIEKWCYNDTDAGCTYIQSTTSPAHTEQDGGLYQWNEAMQYSTTPGARGICPSGWHIPTHDELTTLERAVCTSGTCATDFPYDTTTIGQRGTTEGTKLEPGGSSLWEGNIAGHGLGGLFGNRGAYGGWWSSSENGGSAWVRNLNLSDVQVYRVTDDKAYGLSVRCLKDAPTTTIGETLTTNPDLERGLVGHWTFDGGDFTDKVYDTSGNGNHGYVYGIATSSVKTLGTIGQGVQFHNIDGQYINAGDINALDGLTAVTASAWIKGTSEDEQHFVNKSACNGIGGTGPFELFSGYWGAGKPTFLIYDADTTPAYHLITSSLATNDGAWHHVTGVYDGADVIIYVDGVHRGSTSAPGVTLTSTSATLEMGSCEAQTGINWDGSLDDVRVYNRALSAAEVKRLHGLGGGMTVGNLCDTDRVRDADGNEYDTIVIGSQCWMKQNMRVGTRVDVSTAQTNNAVIEKWCYSNSDASCTDNHLNQPDGGLYQWNEAMQYSTTPGARGICPTGWHIPTHDEYTTLERAICTSGSCATDFPYDTSTTGYRGTDEGTKLKANGSSGFEGNLAGFGASGSFNSRDSNGYFWSSVESVSDAWYRNITSSNAQVSRNTVSKAFGLSVRCIKDS